MKKIIFIAAGLILWLSPVYSQRLVRHYATQKVDKRLRDQFPELLKERSKIEKQVSDFKLKGQPEVFTVPVAFHVIYKKGQSFPSPDQIFAQLDLLNADFQTAVTTPQQIADVKEKFLDRSASADIRFCIATASSPEQMAINYIQTEVTKWGADDAIKHKSNGGADPWDTKKYLNIWVGYLADSISGYAQLPGGPGETDGIVIDMRFFGPQGFALPPYDRGKTLTHLTGNYLGLNDLWDEAIPCGDDGVDDTPVHNAPNYGAPGYRHVSLCHNYPVEMTMNFMDNTDDAMQYMFTVGQKYRMQAMLSEKGPRGMLVLGKAVCAEKVNNLANNWSVEGAIGSRPLAQIGVYPNPAVSEFRLEINAPQEGDLVYVVYNTLGNVMASSRINLAQGLNTRTLDCGKWPAGVYIIHSIYQERQYANRVILTKN